MERERERERERRRNGRGGNLSSAGMWVVMIINRWCMTVLSLGDGIFGYPIGAILAAA
jgi:hypothetical protein